MVNLSEDMYAPRKEVDEKHYKLFIDSFNKPYSIKGQYVEVYLLGYERNKIHKCPKSCLYIDKICDNKDKIALEPDKTTFTFSVLKVMVKNIFNCSVNLSFHDYAQIIDSIGGVYKPFFICDELIPRGDKWRIFYFI